MKKALHPDFTSVIHNILTDRKSVNVYSHQTKELKRLIDDLDQTKPAEIRLIRLSLKKYADNFTALLSTLCEHLGIKVGSRMDFSTVIHQFLSSTQKNIWLILEDFDYMPAPLSKHKSVEAAGYNIDFLHHLDGLRNHAQVAMLFTSTCQLAMTDLYLGGKKIKGSRLELSYHLELPELLLEELQYELIRLNPHLQNPFFKSREWIWLSIRILKTQKSYEFLQYISSRIVPEKIKSLSSFKEIVKTWETAFLPPFKKDKILEATKLSKGLSKNGIQDSTLNSSRDLHVGDTIHNHYYKD